MNWLLRLIWMMLLRQTGRRLVRDTKARGVLVYLKTLNVTRKTLMLVLLGTLVVHLFLLATMGTLVTGVFLYSADLQSALKILFITFASLLGFFLLATAFLFSQFFWYRLSGAKKMVENLRRDAA